MQRNALKIIVALVFEKITICLKNGDNCSVSDDARRGRVTSHDNT
jgi:hypothetical protein